MTGVAGGEEKCPFGGITIFIGESKELLEFGMGGLRCCRSDEFREVCGEFAL